MYYYTFIFLYVKNKCINNQKSLSTDKLFYFISYCLSSGLGLRDHAKIALTTSAESL